MLLRDCFGSGQCADGGGLACLGGERTCSPGLRACRASCPCSQWPLAARTSGEFSITPGFVSPPCPATHPFVRVVAPSTRYATRLQAEKALAAGHGARLTDTVMLGVQRVPDDEASAVHGRQESVCRPSLLCAFACVCVPFSFCKRPW